MMMMVMSLPERKPIGFMPPEDEMSEVVTRCHPYNRYEKINK